MRLLARRPAEANAHYQAKQKSQQNKDHDPICVNHRKLPFVLLSGFKLLTRADELFYRRGRPKNIPIIRPAIKATSTQVRVAEIVIMTFFSWRSRVAVVLSSLHDPHSSIKKRVENKYSDNQIAS